MNSITVKYFARTLLFVIFSLVVLFVVRASTNEQQFLIDAGGVGGFASIFGALWGILVAFIIYMVWLQFNSTSMYIESEANALKHLYRLTLCLKNHGSVNEMRETIKTYTELVIAGGFKAVAAGKRNPETSGAFHQIFLSLIRINLEGERDQLVYDRILGQYKELSDARTKRQIESLTRLPAPLKGLGFVRKNRMACRWYAWGQRFL